MNLPAAVLPDLVTVRFADAGGNPTAPETVPAVKKTDAEWRAQLGPESHAILRSQSTERPFCGMLLKNEDHGLYHCLGCDLPLFTSRSKFDSGTGWPSFFAPFASENIGEEMDHSLPERPRMEIHCNRCGGHLGHVFPDGPPPTGRRYCLNSLALVFRPFAEIRKD
jgi:methionine-R-sulfoxide reductase